MPRPLLSRSIEDTGTMLESLVPWHATALFMVATLGVPVAAYARLSPCLTLPLRSSLPCLVRDYFATRPRLRKPLRE